MLSSILHVLAILGFVLLCILGFVLVVVLAVLLVPVRYRIRLQKEDGWQKEKLHIDIRAGWLLGLLRVRMKLPEPRLMRVKLLCFTLFDPDKKKDDKESEKKRRPKKGKDKSGKDRPKKKPPKGPEAQTKEQQPETAPVQEPEEANAQEPDAEKKQGPIARLRALFQKILYTIRSICDKIKAIFEAKNYYLELLGSEEFANSFMFARDKLFKVLKHVLPRRLKGEILFGMKEPDQTGYVLGIISIIRGLRGYDKLNIRADFEREVMEANLYCGGRIRLITLVLIGLQVYFNKDLRGIIKKFKREEE